MVRAGPQRDSSLRHRQPAVFVKQPDSKLEQLG